MSLSDSVGPVADLAYAVRPLRRTYCKSSDCSAAAAPQLEAGVAGLRWSGATWPAAQRRPAPGRRRLGRRRPGDPAPARRRVHRSRVEQGTGPRSPGSPGSRREPPTPRHARGRRPARPTLTPRPHGPTRGTLWLRAWHAAPRPRVRTARSARAGRDSKEGGRRHRGAEAA